MTHPLAFVVEDDPVLVDVFAKALQEAQYETRTFLDGQKAQEALNRDQPNLVVLDLHLPKVSGEDLLRNIQISDRFSRSRVIIVSADAVMTSYLRDEVDLVLEKPVSFHQLRELSARLHPDFDTGSLKKKT